MEKKKKVLIIGVIGADVHAVGNKILYHAFTEAGFDVVNLGVMVSQEEYIAAATEATADSRSWFPRCTDRASWTAAACAKSATRRV